MKLWLLFPVLLPAAWAVLTFGGYWPEPYAEIGSNPILGLSLTGVGLVLAWAVERSLRSGGPDRLPTAREIERAPDPRGPLIEGLPPEPASNTTLRVPMPDDPTNAPPPRR